MSIYDLPNEIRVEVDGPVRVVRLNRPERLNATNHVLHNALASVWPQIDADDGARAAVLTGAGRAFSAGGDYSYLAEDYPAGSVVGSGRSGSCARPASRAPLRRRNVIDRVFSRQPCPVRT